MNCDNDQPPRKIRVVLLMPCSGLRKWQVDSLDALRRQGYAELVGAVVAAGSETNPRAGIRHGAVGAFKQGIKRVLLPKAMQAVTLPSYIAQVGSRVCRVERKGIRELLPQSDLDWIAAKQPDVLLRFGFGILSGEVLRVAPSGVWSFHHGDLERYRGRPPAFWEMRAGELRIGVTLQRLNEKLDSGRILAKGHVPAVGWSYRRSLARVYDVSQTLLRRAMSNLYHDVQAREREADRLGALYKSPKVRDWVGLTSGQVRYFVSWAVEKAFFRPAWRIGVADGPESGLLQPAHLANATWLDGPSDGFWADPCFMPGHAESALVEAYIDSKRRGHIAAIRFDGSAGSAAACHPVVQASRHLSFPQVHREEGCLWLVPEMGSWGTQYAYPLSEQNGAFVAGEPITIEGLKGVDPVIFRHEGRYWAFTSPTGAKACYELNLYIADHFFGPYTAHPANPVVIDPHGGRCAGPVQWIEGCLYRFGQVYGERYGEGIDVFEITYLGTDGYSERRVRQIRPEAGDKLAGVHTIDFSGARVLIDGFGLKFDGLAGVRRVLGRLGGG